MNEAKLKAYVALANGDKLVDPKYAPHPNKAEERLKARVKECWGQRKDFPDFVEAYVQKWIAAEGDNRNAVPTNAAG